jgi:hypothetical protein
MSGAGLNNWRAALTPVVVLAGDTWRLAWREVMTRVELVMLLILAVVSGVAAIGSPTAANGTVQMLAVCLEVVPFALVLVAGQVWRRTEDETALYSRPLTALTYMAGRGLGLWVVGLAQLAAVNLMADLTLVLVAHLGWASGAWDAWWSLLVVVPSELLVTGATLLVVTVTGGGARYYTLAIVGSLVVALAEYKLSALAAATDPRLVLWSPFPALLTLGLAMPPVLAHYQAGWLWPNRLLYAAGGLALLALAALRRGRGLELPLARRRPAQVTLAALLLVAAVGLVWLEGWAVANAPNVLSPSVVAAAADTTAPLAPGSLTLQVTVNPAAGAVQGQAVWRGAVERSAASVYVWLNRGLDITAASDGTAPLDVVRVAGGAVEADTAASLWLLAGHLGSGAPLVITYRGRLLPTPTLLPTPPFRVGVSYEGAYAAPGVLALDGNGSWYPRLLAAGAGGAPLPSAMALTLSVVGDPGRAVYTVLTQSGSGWRLPPGAPWPRVLWLSGPYVARRLGALVVATPPGSPPNPAGLAPYESSWPALRPWLPGAGQTLYAVTSPVATAPLLTGSLLALPGNQPYCVPPDPVTAACGGVVAAPLAARLLLSSLAWENVLGLSGGNLPVLQPAVSAGDERATLAPVLAVLSVWRSETGTEAATVAQAWTGRAALPVVGTLNATQAAVAAQLARSPAFASPAGVQALARTLAAQAVGLTLQEVLHDAGA